uniref:Uncharacterized protein n=1 Tax=Cacopsylla melanoneura TaxID=428564 RepID=A0A8D9AJ52_9HEMI
MSNQRGQGCGLLSTLSLKSWESLRPDTDQTVYKLCQRLQTLPRLKSKEFTGTSKRNVPRESSGRTRSRESIHSSFHRELTSANMLTMYLKQWTIPKQDCLVSRILYRVSPCYPGVRLRRSFAGHSPCMISMGMDVSRGMR